VISTVPVTVPLPRPEHIDLFNEGPRWRTLSLALLLSIGASGSGAFLVRALRSHHQPAALAPAFAPALPATSLAGPSVPAVSPARAAAATEPAPRVVDLSSLSIEHVAPRAQPRPAAVTPEKASEPGDNADHEGPAEAAPSAPARPKSVDLFAAERASASARDTTDNDGVKLPVAASSAEPGL
jgi:hypothetical protein